MWLRLGRSIRTVFFTMAASKSTVKAGVFSAFGIVLWLFGGLPVSTSLATVFGVYLISGGWRYVKVILRTAPRDFKGLKFLISSKMEMNRLTENGSNLVTLFQETVRRHPQKLCFVCIDGNSLTFQEVDDYSNRIANFLFERGYRKGDVIAVYMENCAEYACLWLGMAKIGAVGALLNFNLRDASLAHCINAAKAKGIIYQTDLTAAVQEALPKIDENIARFCFGDENPDSTAVWLNRGLEHASSMQPPQHHKTGFNEKLFFIYTSGTTGLPKAAIVIHSRFFYMATSSHHFFKMNTNDVLYDTLPLYHTAGGILGVGQGMLRGCTVVIRKKFSASRFWDDCIEHNCTVTQYIGEMARYLLAQPVKPSEDQHRVRIAFGNGLRPQIWSEFKRRFHVKTIGEFYGATEGNANIINIDNKVGAVGFASRILPSFYPVTLIKVDEVTGEPVRDRLGMCVHCEPGQPGELVGKIVKGDPLREFDGYANESASKKKIAENVFTRGDTAFLTGDVLVMDEDGYMYFKDRTGDTFRWRGENVSTAEVEATISNIVKLKDACVYGVEVPGAEGRAGMAAIVDDQHNIDLVHLHKELCKKLPAYARPLFIRLLNKVDQTGTFKLKKVDYRKDGFNPAKTSDKMFYLNAKQGGYLPIDEKSYEEIKLGKVRL